MEVQRSLEKKILKRSKLSPNRVSYLGNIPFHAYMKYTSPSPQLRLAKHEKSVLVRIFKGIREN